MSCKDFHALEWPDPKHPAATEDYGVDFTGYLTRWRAPATDYALTTRVRVKSRPGFEYECTTAGQTGQKEPIFPTAIATTVTDGSVTWTCRAVTTGSLKATVASVAWTADSAAITIDNETLTGQMAAADLSGGTDETDYALTVTATLSDGRVVPAVSVLHVRIPTAPACCA